MRYLIASAAVLVCLMLSGVGVWMGQQLALAPFILPDAMQIQVIQPRFGTTVIMYRADARTWRARLSRQLAQAGWTVHNYANPGATLPQWTFVSWYTRDTWFGPLGMREHAQFLVDRNDPTQVSMQIDRSVAIWQFGMR